MVICLEQGADLHMAQLMQLPVTVSCFNKTQIGFTFLVLAHLGSPGKRAIKWVCLVSQGSIAKHLRNDNLLYCTIITQSAGKRIFKIGEHLVKLQAKW